MGGVLAAALLPCGLTPRTHTCVCVHRPKDLTQIDQSNEPNKPHAQPSSTATAARWRGRPSGEGSSSCGPWCVYLVVPVPLCLSFVLGAYTAKDCSCCCCLGVQAGARIYPVCLASVQSNPIQRPLPPPTPPKKNSATPSRRPSPSIRPRPRPCTWATTSTATTAARPPCGSRTWLFFVLRLCVRLPRD